MTKQGDELLDFIDRMRSAAEETAETWFNVAETHVEDDEPHDATAARQIGAFWFSFSQFCERVRSDDRDAAAPTTTMIELMLRMMRVPHGDKEKGPGVTPALRNIE